MQTQGRGRFQKSWYSGLGDSLTFSVLWRFDRSINDLSGLSLVIGIAVVRALKKFGIGEITLKWPNDVLYRFRKLAGILIEHSNIEGTGTTVIIGIGINVSPVQLYEYQIKQPVIDLFSITGLMIKRNKLFATLLSELAIILKDFNIYGFNYFRNEWISCHAYEGKLITFTLPDGSEMFGMVDEVECNGSIRIKMPSGVKFSFSSGELNLR